MLVLLQLMGMILLNSDYLNYFLSFLSIPAKSTGKRL